MTTGCELSNRRPSFSDIPMKSNEKAAHLWLSICAASAARTEGGTSTGPGVNKYFLKIKTSLKNKKETERISGLKTFLL